MSSSNERTYPEDKPLIWKDTDQLPQNEDLLVVFHGLLSFCYRKDAPHCEIGVFNQDLNHQLCICIDGGNCSGQLRYRYNSDELLNVVNSGGKFVIETIGADPDVAFYQEKKPFNRVTAPYEFDFRWLIDVESPDLYADKIRNKKPHYRPKLIVRNGTFFTLEHTKSTFKFVNRIKAGDERKLGSIAFCTGLKIKLKEGQRAKFSFKDPDGYPQSCTFDPKGGKDPARIFFANVCFKDGHPSGVNDFYRHFETFDPPVGNYPYDLKVDQFVAYDHSCGGMSGCTGKVEPMLDDAPCHAMGYGGSQGTP